jgi:hypothetical protein
MYEAEVNLRGGLEEELSTVEAEGVGVESISSGPILLKVLCVCNYGSINPHSDTSSQHSAVCL